MVPRDELEDFTPRARTRKFVLLAVGGLIAVSALAYGIFAPAPGGGETTPEFDLQLINAPGRLSSSELKGSPVVLNFFASWCVPCREEAPLLQKAFEAHRDEGVIFVGVSIRDAASDARAFADRYGITYPIVHDPRESLAGPIGVLGLQETYFIDRNWHFVGNVAGDRIGNRQGTVWFGPISRADLEQRIAALLEDGA